MHNRDKYPAIWEAKEKAEKELAPLLTERKKYTKAMGDIQVRITNLSKEKLAINIEAMKDADRIGELRDTVSRMAKAMGAVVATNGTA